MSRKVWYCSDLHYSGLGVSVDDLLKEFEIIKDGRKDDWLIIAGDVGDFRTAFYLLLKASEYYGQVFFVFGNHEFYDALKVGRTYKYFISNLKKEFIDIDNVHILNNSSVTIDGITVAGSTNWYYLPDNYSRAWWGTFSNDYTYVHPEGAKGSNLHSLEDTEYLNSLSGNVDILITHVPPIHFKDNDFDENFAFMHPLDNLAVTPEYWVCGHQHFVANEEYKGSRILANPRGYKGEETYGNFRLRSFNV